MKFYMDKHLLFFVNYKVNWDIILLDLYRSRDGEKISILAWDNLSIDVFKLINSKDQMLMNWRMNHIFEIFFKDSKKSEEVG